MHGGLGGGGEGEGGVGGGGGGVGGLDGGGESGQQAAMSDWYGEHELLLWLTGGRWEHCVGACVQSMSTAAMQYW